MPITYAPTTTGYGTATIGTTNWTYTIPNEWATVTAGDICNDSYKMNMADYIKEELTEEIARRLWKLMSEVLKKEISEDEFMRILTEQ